ncbi:MAG: acetyl-CoA carboxylase biotin carboxylase subunit [Actinobacteria bacterium]|nr:acetyl-CoA carboxylase biotin carboxylase subunit [Actinomycetota bacterium]
MARIRKVLVANRGEIAIRIFRACRDLDIATVAIYSEIDRDALHVHYADEAFFVGDTAPAKSYLSIPRILQAANLAGADAIHPGYGFLAESSAFAAAVTEAGLIWIGPPADAIEQAGDKVSARKIAAAASVASVPGTSEPISGPEEIKAFAAEHGWPVALKAAKGGGGRGFRVVKSLDEALEAFESATREAEVSFGSSQIYLERYLENPRHVEVQIIADTHGNVVHLGERDCSLQRRHQKLVEESPSPAVGPELRKQMGEAAVRLARQVGYSSAGTVEFLLEQNEAGPEFWFLEMNTRLQVEHPVTELVTGLDLTQLMIQVAQGDELGFDQADVTFRGHAIECRINAENPAQDFLPNPGKIERYQEPSGPGVRVDAGVRAGGMISAHYDSLISKLICYGGTRDQAIKAMLRALDEYRIGGLVTTIPFHQLALSSPWFGAGDFSTKTVENAMDLSELDVGPMGRSAAPAGHRRYSVEVNGKRYEVKVLERSQTLRQKPRPPDLSPSAGLGSSGDELTAQMQGTVVKVLRKVGDEVVAGDPILVLEAMKMENQVTCHVDGVVSEIRFQPGQTASIGAVLAVVTPTDS